MVVCSCNRQILRFALQISFLGTQQLVCNYSKSKWKDFSLPPWLYLLEKALLTSAVQCLFSASVCKPTLPGCGMISTQRATELCSFTDTLNTVFGVGGMSFWHALNIYTWLLSYQPCVSRLGKCLTKSGSMMLIFFFIWLGVLFKKKEVKTLRNTN